MYHPTDGNPYVMASIGGHIYKIDPDNADAAIDLSTSPGLVNPSGQLQSYFVQGEQFLVIQAGDYVTLPLFWDGATLRRSVGLSATSGLVLVVAGFQLNNFIVPTQGGQTGLGFPPVLAAGDTIRMIQSGTTSSIGDFQVTSYSVTEADMIKLDPNQQAYTTNIKVDIYQVIAPSTAELPAAGPMDYYMGRIWYAQGRIYSAGDTVGNQASGTLAYNFTDAILKVTENPLAIGGDGFAVQASSGNITALKHPANLNTQLGQGQLLAFTRK